MTLILVFLLGALIGALWMAIRAQAPYKAQNDLLQQYHTMLQGQLNHEHELLKSYQDLTTTVAELREQCLQHQIQRERLLHPIINSLLASRPQVELASSPLRSINPIAPTRRVI